jgi:hypothetical protein
MEKAGLLISILEGEMNIIEESEKVFIERNFAMN